MKSPVFQVIRDFLIKQEEFKGLVLLKVTRPPESKKYYFILLEQQATQLHILGKAWQCQDQHISIYEEQLLTEKNFQSTYHYTGTFKHQNEIIIVHVYIDRYGIFQYINLKNNQGERIAKISEQDEKLTKIYAEAACAQMINKIQTKIASIANTFTTEFNSSLERLDVLSKDLSTATCESHEVYLKQLDKCLSHCINLETYTYDESIKHYHKRLLSTANFLKQRMKQISMTDSNKPLNCEEPSDTEDSHSAENTGAESSAVTVKDKQRQRLIDIKNQLKTLSAPNLAIDQLIQKYQLLKEQFKLEKEFDLIITIMNAMNKTRGLLMLKMLQFIAAEDITTVKKLLEFVELMPQQAFLNVIAKGNIALARILQHHYHINLNTTNDFFVNFEHLHSIAKPFDTPLLTALDKDHYDMFMWLLDKGANPNIANNITGETPLIRSLVESKPKYLEALLKHHADANARLTIQNFTGVHMFGELASELRTHLIEINEKIRSRPNTRKTPLYLACDFEQAHSVKLLLQYGADPHIPAANGYSAYMSRVLNENEAIKPEYIQLFLTAGVNVDERHPTNRMTGLYFACQKGRLDDVRYFVNRGANPNLPTIAISSPMLIKHWNPQSLIDHGIFKPQIKSDKRDLHNVLNELLHGENKSQFTPLSKAAVNGHSDIVMYLLSQQITPVTKDNALNALVITQLFSQHDCAALLYEHLKLSDISLDEVKTLQLTH